MDPGNWATDLAGGAKYGYTLLSVIMISNLMAILLQALSARLGIASGRDLAQACRDSYSRPTVYVLWLLCEVAIAACDLAEVIGAAIALNLLLGLPLIWGVCLTALDVLVVLFLQHRGFRYVEALVIALIALIAGSFAVEIIFSQPSFVGIVKGFFSRASRSSGTPRCCMSRSASSAPRSCRTTSTSIPRSSRRVSTNAPARECGKPSSSAPSTQPSRSRSPYSSTPQS
jgi:NRAMP (natural resistance-associated macrophage protein)-like metal ion transporter